MVAPVWITTYSLKASVPSSVNGANFDICTIGSLCGLDETLHIKTPESFPPKQMLIVFAIVDLSLL